MDCGLFEEVDGAGYEVAEVAAFEEAVGEEGEVNKLVDFGRAGGICVDCVVLFGACFAYGFFEVFYFLLGFGRHWLIAGRVAYCIDGFVVRVDFFGEGFDFGFESFVCFGCYFFYQRVLGVDYECVAVGQFAVEIHAGLHGCHFFHAAHVLVLGENNGFAVFTKGFELYHKAGLLDFASAVFEEAREDGALYGCEFGDFSV